LNEPSRKLNDEPKLLNEPNQKLNDQLKLLNERHPSSKSDWFQLVHTLYTNRRFLLQPSSCDRFESRLYLVCATQISLSQLLSIFYRRLLLFFQLHYQAKFRLCLFHINNRYILSPLYILDLTNQYMSSLH